ncbi:hypothetical protein [Rhodovulum adriaticum]|uniref:Uncharacterized protein n=1 Tax=Rhodovulum adriaticum TaxID=35804 RepID=A0A4R2NP82_RHOAD|nr:hypothetical protein [Rhodovulum adriaticum]MBK1634482.1 hypothetical protein [Rhodovulum adriaticum]TCP23148.1 hypothetical protein EV656_104119 [Rhodovulum adriaticum]
MSPDDLTMQIVAFTSQCGHGADPAKAAQARGWIDEAGRPTKDGQALIAALREQSRYGAYRLVG